MKKFMSMVLAGAMLLSLATAASAAEADTQYGNVTEETDNQKLLLVAGLDAEVDIIAVTVPTEVPVQMVLNKVAGQSGANQTYYLEKVISPTVSITNNSKNPIKVDITGAEISSGTSGDAYGLKTKTLLALAAPDDDKYIGKPGSELKTMLDTGKLNGGSGGAFVAANNVLFENIAAAVTADGVTTPGVGQFKMYGASNAFTSAGAIGGASGKDVIKGDPLSGTYNATITSTLKVSKVEAAA